jgi:hypothetical protein
MLWSDLESSLKRFTSTYSHIPETRRPANAETELSRIRHDLTFCIYQCTSKNDFRDMVKIEGIQLRKKITDDWSCDNLLALEIQLVINVITQAILNPGE